MALKLSLTPKLTTEQQLALLQTGLNADAIQLDKEAKIKTRIDSGEITAANFSSLTTSEQDTVKLVLFKNFSPSTQDISKSLSAVEFALCSLTKLFYATVDKSKLNSNETAFLDSFYDLFCKNDMPIDNTTDWRYQYLDQIYSSVQTNRQAYFDEKTRVIGSI